MLPPHILLSEEDDAPAPSDRGESLSTLNFWAVVPLRAGSHLVSPDALEISQAASPTTVDYRGAQLTAIVLPRIG